MDILRATRAYAVKIAGARDGAAYFDNPTSTESQNNSPGVAANGGTASAAAAAAAGGAGAGSGSTEGMHDFIARMQISEEKLCVPTVVTASTHGGKSWTKSESVATVIEVYGRVRSGDVGGFKSGAKGFSRSDQILAGHVPV